MLQLTFKAKRKRDPKIDDKTANEYNGQEEHLTSKKLTKNLLDIEKCLFQECY
jgi:hypothetical protein